ncbi:BatA domain-containing protein [Hymenobacter bucti]|uniref:BatA domain-containing protein n=1 Tax=Hymenobacter bucti TaxID=1844114 RepID=A0ABW4QMT7_9BACT
MKTPFLPTNTYLLLALTTPSALLALLGLLVPLAIHLWNRRPGQEVAVGSLRWLTAGANRRLRNLRLEQVLLLLLRAALLAVLAVAVAGPVWRQVRPGGRGQVLISPELAGTSSLAAVRPSIDSLRRRGYALRWLGEGLPKISKAAWRADSLGRQTDSVRALSQGATVGFAWERIRQAADTFAGQPLHVLTPATLRGAQGTHSVLPANMTWQTLPLTTETTWLQAASGSRDSLRLLLGHSTERQTTFRTVAVARPAAGQQLTGPALPPLRYEAPNTGLAQVQPLPITPADSGWAQPAVPVRPAALRVWVYTTPAYTEDARYLRAALRAASAGLPGPLALTVATTLPDPASAPDWLFWLSAAPVPAAWRGRVGQGLHLWQSATGPGVADTTALAALALEESTPVTIWRRAQQPVNTAAEPLWTDGLGRTVLARQEQGQGAIYQLTTRLNSAWSELPDSPALPALLLSVLRPESVGAELARLGTHDQRRLDPAQLPTSATQVAGPPAPTDFQLLDLRPWLVLLAALLLAVERWLATRRAAFTSPSLA